MDLKSLVDYWPLLVSAAGLVGGWRLLQKDVKILSVRQHNVEKSQERHAVQLIETAQVLSNHALRLSAHDIELRDFKSTLMHHGQMLGEIASDMKVVKAIMERNERRHEHQE